MTIGFCNIPYFFPMMIHGLGFLSLSASLVLPWALTGLVQGQRITESFVKDVRQSSTVPTVQQMPLPNRKLISAASTATTYYVSGTGDDKKSGLSTSSAFRTLQRAANLTLPGDTVLVMNGVYKNIPGGAGAVLSIKRSGNANAWIKYKAYPGHFPKIQHNTWNGIVLSNGVSYIEINGLEVIGNNANITLAYALSQKYNRSNPLTSGNCITIDGSSSRVHHINILNSKVHDCGGAGIGVMAADYLKLDNNTVYNNAWYTVYGTSGISILNSWNFDGNQGYKIFLTNNKLYNNRMYVPWIDAGRISDGNGMIVDSSRNGPSSKLKLSPYKGRTLIANNISYKNGGSGLHVFNSDHVDIINNTVYANTQSPELKKSQSLASFSSDIKIINNIIQADPGQSVNRNYANTNMTYDHNLYNKSAVVGVIGPHDLFGDAQFVNPSIGDFRLKSTSPAIDRGYKWTDLKTDYAGNRRPAGSGYDIGAYEQ
ncbi:MULTISPECIES: right-handed parallel beta-helix repeat-containing protein [unclassified Nostoc]|uniref:right-handed parallel beta-helix repeat-containing protein n=1 Tax=unclassified Nostoc TaxID=2593658 RepID=UPI002AD45CFC|nr:right-handed parallel beta-helix repeat-containing protein [Nostoc sp. DedQUE03]MDZ7973991.1 right-handed parallel beta-helix repeat-containing protein [Nostoc sp. DedQUE03]MDZ8045773.1 right-handed parallel beta-helix repeat-containing protein [Nostoc sp. DedQUE02]